MLGQNRVMVMPGQRTQRTTRSPQHPFFVRYTPWGIQPFFIAPVLPGETMTRLNLQARVVTKPIKNRVIGWWQEFYFFYCPFQSLPSFESDWKPMLVDASGVSDGPDAVSNSPNYYRKAEGANAVDECAQAVVNAYFRHEVETFGEYTLLSGAAGSLPAAAVNQKSWLESLGASADFAADVDVDVDALGAGANIMASEVETAMMQYQMLKLRGLTEMSYEDYLRSYGIRALPSEVHLPELVRYIRTWQYPSNTIDPADGSAASAVSWAVAERADRRRAFREPGFLFGLCVTRPKAYRLNQRAAAVQLLDNAYVWLPAMLRNDYQISRVKHAAPAANEVLQLNDDVNADSGIDDAYEVDMRDLFLYGDQFVNIDLATAADINGVKLPYQSGAFPVNTAYPSHTDVEGLFVTAADAETGVEADGIVTVSIASSLYDQSQATPSLAQA